MYNLVHVFCDYNLAVILIQECELNREDAMDHNKCRKQIRMIDDHDRCEWVNVSSGTGSPGLSQTKCSIVAALM